MSKSQLLIAANILSICACLTTAQAQEEAITSTTYTPADFEIFSPRTALDIVENLPGFTISSSSSQQRGMGQNTGNVLINGKPVSGKSVGLRSILSQINAKDVQKIEVKDASAFSLVGVTGDVANIQAKLGKFAGQWSWTPRFEQHKEASIGNASLTLTGQQGIFDYRIALRNRASRRSERGPEVVRNANHNIVENRLETSHSESDVPSLTTKLGFEFLNGNTGNINFSYAQPKSHYEEISFRQPNNKTPSFRVSKGHRDEWNSEFSGDYELAFGTGRLKLLGLIQKKHRPLEQQVHTLVSDVEYANATGSNALKVENERIARAEYSWETRSHENWQISAESAFNSLKNTNIRLKQLENSQELGKRSETDVPKIDIVEEKRSELTLSHSRSLGKKLNLQSTVSGEYSQISQRGAAQADRSMFHPKGFTSINYTHSKNLSINTRLQRHVKQYNFSNFIASRNLSDESANETNAGIVPEKSWLLSVSLKKKLGEFGSSNLRIFGEDVKDVVAQIPIGENAEATGNIDHAERFGAEMSGTVKFTPLGIEGLRLNYFLSARDSNLIDPVTNVSRQIGGEKKSDVNLSMRYDLPETNWALTGGIQKSRWAFNPRISQNIRRYADEPYTQVTVEHRDVFGMKATLGLHNLGNQTQAFYKALYPDRREQPLSRTEYRTRKRGTAVSMSLRGSF